MPAKIGNTLLKIYFLIISLTGIIGATVAYGTVISAYLEKQFVTNEEYLLDSSRDIKACSNPDTETIPNMKDPTQTITTSTKPSPVDIKNCEDKVTSDALLRRDLTFKRGAISGLVRGTLFLILFVFHFPTFLNALRKEHAAS